MKTLNIRMCENLDAQGAQALDVVAEIGKGGLHEHRRWRGPFVPPVGQ